MNEHETTELLERLVAPLEPNEPPIWDLMERGRRERGRRRGITALVVAAAVAGVVGGTAALAGQLPDSSTGPVRPPATSPTGDPQPAERELNDIDLNGQWVPREVLGEVIDSGNAYVPGVLFHGPRLTFSTDGCELAMGPFSAGPQGEFSVGELNYTTPYCVDEPGTFVQVPNNQVVLQAARLQVVDGVLRFYDKDWELLGIYDRAWSAVESEDLRGTWRLVSRSDRSLSLDELGQSLDREELRSRALVRLFEDRYEAGDGINTTFGRYEVGDRGEFRDWDQSTTLVGCLTVIEPRDGVPAYPPVEPMPVVPPTTQPVLRDECETVPNAEIIDAATRVQWFDKMSLLVFYGDDGMSIGVYSQVPGF